MHGPQMRGPQFTPEDWMLFMNNTFGLEEDTLHDDLGIYDDDAQAVYSCVQAQETAQ